MRKDQIGRLTYIKWGKWMRKKRKEKGKRECNKKRSNRKTRTYVDLHTQIGENEWERKEKKRKRKEKEERKYNEKRSNRKTRMQTHIRKNEEKWMR